MKKTPKTARYEVLVGNLGVVWTFEGTATHEIPARHEFNGWLERSKAPYGRASGEAVTLFKDGEILKEYNPPGDPDGPV